MKQAFARTSALIFVVTIRLAVGDWAHGAEIQAPTIRTNLVDRWITNTAEVQLQVNRFVTEFHTNWIIRVQTNIVKLYSTNTLTAYFTNRIQVVKTNSLNFFSTNLTTKTVTNRFIVDAYQTNFVQAYQTNLKALNLTNWTTIVVLKTNWVMQPVTNVVAIDMPSEQRPSSVPIEKGTKVENKLRASSEPLALQAVRSGAANTNNQIEVQLTVSWTLAPGTPVQVQQWRIEREDGSFLCFGQDAKFKRVLPQGTYKVTVKAQRDAHSPLLAALGTLTVGSREVLLEQRPAPSNSSI